MKIRSLAYHIKDGFKNIHRNKMFSLASIATITACIFLFGVFYSIVVNFQYMIKKAETEVCVTVFFDENLSETDIKKLGDEISKREEVSRKKIEECLLEQSTGWQVLKGSVRKSVEVLLFEKTKRKPSVFPIIMDV